MSFTFGKKSQKANSQEIKQVKEWIYQAFQLDEEVSISLSQLHCTEPGCSPIETVINLMTDPVQQYKIHKSIAAIEYSDISKLVEDKLVEDK